jgi:aspartyl/asparaginyl-tRNA synthetase
MIEPEMAFATLEDNMENAEAYLKYCLKYVMTNNIEEIKYLDDYHVKQDAERKVQLAKKKKQGLKLTKPEADFLDSKVVEKGLVERL